MKTEEIAQRVAILVRENITDEVSKALDARGYPDQRKDRKDGGQVDSIAEGSGSSPDPEATGPVEKEGQCESPS